MSTVLIVDDEPDVRMLTRLLLEMEGHEVCEAVDGESALTLLGGSHAFDVVLLDIRMPGMSGWEVLAKLRADPRLEGLRVVVFSAHTEPRDLERALTEGATAYLTKPFTEEQLLAALASSSE